MLVRELIEILEKCDQNADVTWGYEQCAIDAVEEHTKKVSNNGEMVEEEVEVRLV